MENAPFHADLAEGPAGGYACWLRADDGVRLRVGHWPCVDTDTGTKPDPDTDTKPDTGTKPGTKGSVLIFPGRTECIEKYGRAAQSFAARGFGTVAIDWRGQGLADRLLGNPMIGHVGAFGDYQRDVDAVLAWARETDLPQPWYLVGHSMGGAIGLLALHARLPVRAAVFSAPMWGIRIAPMTRPAAEALSWLSTRLGFDGLISPGTKQASYVLAAPFDDNMLTTDSDMWDYMKRQIETDARLGLGGPSLGWLQHSLRACQALMRTPAPDTPTLTFLGDQERIVDAEAVKRRMADWPGGRLHMVKGAEHEVLMENPDIREGVFDVTAAYFKDHP